ncbi:MAG: YdeI family protein [Chitinophagaceae bacterium]
MKNTDSRLDAYIQKAAPFAQPILNHLRALVHRAFPDIQETMKWSMPHFDYKGTVCGMAAFKQHCTFGFWKESLLKESNKALSEREKNAMGSFGRITSLKDLPSDKVIIDLVKQAVKLNEEGVKVQRSKPGSTALEIPDYILSELDKHTKAKTTFENFPPSHKKEYVQWITEAKTDETRKKRMATMMEWLAEGKGRNWKYEKR